MQETMKLTALLLLCAIGANSQGFVALQNISYGNDPQQVMDVYLPGGRNTTVSKVIVLIHGGGWGAGKKEDMLGYAVWFYQNFPRYAIVNIGYRLATETSPAYPKQIVDIGLALQYIRSKQTDYQIKPEFALVGASAGAHLAMLYAYKSDKSLLVNIVCNIVGPSDLTDPAYTKNPAFKYAGYILVGKYTYEQNPKLYAEVSPVTHITRQSPRTISFYGGKDELIPVSQGTILRDKLNAAGVVNKYYLYPNEGHAFTKKETLDHVSKNVVWFFNTYM